jgi:hypothetical protein
MMTTIRLSGAQVTQLVELLGVVAAAADTSDEDRYQLHYSRSQVGQFMPGVEVLVLAGVLADMTDRPGPDLATRNACRWWSAELAGLLSVASAHPRRSWPAPALTRSGSPHHPRAPTGCPMGRGRSTSPRTARSGCWTRSTTSCWCGSQASPMDRGNHR